MGGWRVGTVAIDYLYSKYSHGRVDLAFDEQLAGK
jgi:hypothetical protein